MNKLASLKRLVTLRARQVDRAEAELRGAEAQVAALQASLMAAPPIDQLQVAQDFWSWQTARDDGYRRLPQLKATASARQQELSAAKLALRQMESVFDKAAGAQSERAARQEAAMVDAWVASRHARSLSQ